MLYHLNRFLMGLKMSDEIDTDMIEESLIVIDRACTEFKKSVLVRATREIRWRSRPIWRMLSRMPMDAAITGRSTWQSASIRFSSGLTT